MKKLIITLVIALAACTAAFAQKGLSVGAGYLDNTVKTVYTSGSTTTTNARTYGGFYAGLSYNVLTLGPGIGITPGLYFASTSFKGEEDLVGGVTSGNESYLAVPVNFSYKLDLVPGTLAIEPYAGPTFAYGLSSKTTYTLGNTSNTTDRYDGTTYGKFDLQVGVGLAFDIVDMIRVTVGYNMGLLDRDSDSDYKVTTSNINFGVAYMF